MKRISPWKIDNRKSTHSAKKNLIMIPSCTKRSQNASVLIAFRYFLNIFAREISRKEQYWTFLYVTSQFHERSIIYIALFLFLTMNVGSSFWISQAFIGHGCGHLCDTIGLNVLVMWHGRNGKKRRLSSLPLLVFFHHLSSVLCVAKLLHRIGFFRSSIIMVLVPSVALCECVRVSVLCKRRWRVQALVCSLLFFSHMAFSSGIGLEAGI